MISIYIGSTLLGTITRGQHFLRFRYDDDFIAHPSAFPISASLPLSRQTHESRKVERYLWNLIPENPLILSDLQRRYKIASLSDPLAILSAIGRDSSGALSFYPEGLSPLNTVEGQLVQVTHAEMAAEFVRLANLKGSYAGRISLAGAQPKTSYRLGADGQWYSPTGLLASTHIFKPSRFDDENLDYVEHALSMTAQRLGIPSVETSIEEYEGVRVFVTRRYDRATTSRGDIARLHQEDLLQALGRDCARKYQKDAGPGVPDLVQFVRQAAPEQERRLWEQLVFNVAVGNADAHAKNWSFLVDHSGHTLAPAYDLISLAPYPQYSQTLAMSIGKQYSYSSVTQEDWQSAAQKAQAEKSVVMQARERILDELPEAFNSVLDELNIDIKQLDTIQTLIRTSYNPSSPTA